MATLPASLFIRRLTPDLRVEDEPNGLALLDSRQSAPTEVPLLTPADVKRPA